MEKEKYKLKNKENNIKDSNSKSFISNNEDNLSIKSNETLIDTEIDPDIEIKFMRWIFSWKNKLS